MIGAKQFALGYGSFWVTAVPMLERFGRFSNGTRYGDFIAPVADPGQRDVAGEAAFLLAKEAVAAGRKVREFTEAEVSAVVGHASVRIAALRDSGQLSVPTAEEREEIAKLAGSIEGFIAYLDWPNVPIFEPLLPGCGIVNHATVDLVIGENLFEIKAVLRNFRSADYTQLFTYCALAYASQALVVERVGLVNPRTGLYELHDLSDLCLSVAGVSVDELMNTIVDFLLADEAAAGIVSENLV